MAQYDPPPAPQPRPSIWGGSVRDDLVVEAVNRLGLAMVVTGVRHFRH